MRLLLALLLAVLAPVQVRAEATSTPGVYLAPAPAPPIFSKLLWVRSPTSTPGFWFTADQTVRINAQLEYLTDHAAQECVSSTVAANRSIVEGSTGFWAGLALGVVAASVASYLALRR
jgi:hypothetical protein